MSFCPESPQSLFPLGLCPPLHPLCLLGPSFWLSVLLPLGLCPPLSGSPFSLTRAGAPSRSSSCCSRPSTCSWGGTKISLTTPFPQRGPDSCLLSTSNPCPHDWPSWALGMTMGSSRRHHNSGSPGHSEGNTSHPELPQKPAPCSRTRSPSPSPSLLPQTLESGLPALQGRGNLAELCVLPGPDGGTPGWGPPGRWQRLDRK